MVDIQPATWATFEELMGERGGCGGCWCMLWRHGAREMEANKGQGNRQKMKALFESGHVPGLVAIQDDKPVGWLQIDRRSAFSRLATSRVLKPIDEEDVWSISCFFVDKRYRRQGVSLKLLETARHWATEKGASLLKVIQSIPTKTNIQRFTHGRDSCPPSHGPGFKRSLGALQPAQ